MRCSLNWQKPLLKVATVKPLTLQSQPTHQLTDPDPASTLPLSLSLHTCLAPPSLSRPPALILNRVARPCARRDLAAYGT
eukprot:1835023-Rhodomonas_salina.1